MPDAVLGRFRECLRRRTRTLERGIPGVIDAKITHESRHARRPFGFRWAPTGLAVGLARLRYATAVAIRPRRTWLHWVPRSRSP